MGRRFTAEERAKAHASATKRLGPDGCSKRASIAARARWAKRDAVVRRKNPPMPPASWVMACMEWVLDGYADQPGWAEQRENLLAVIAWLKQAGK